MDCNFDVTSQNDNSSVFPSYYEYYTRIYGETFFSNVCRVAISNGKYESRALAAVDDAYGHTKTTISDSNTMGPKIIAMKSSEGNDKGYFRIRFLNIEGAIVACVAEVVLANPYSNNRVEELKEMIGAIEEEVTSTSTDVESLDFESGTWDTDMQMALLDLGFNLIETEKSRSNITVMYEKQIRKEKATRE